MPGPKILIVLPLAVLASALGRRALWGALPGWLKARFGANEVINTILLNYIAASLLLFILSSNQISCGGSGAASHLLTDCSLYGGGGDCSQPAVPPVRRSLGRRAAGRCDGGYGPFAGGWSRSVAGVAAWSLAGERTPRQRCNLPFKAPGSEPKSYPLSTKPRGSATGARAGRHRHARSNVWRQAMVHARLSRWSSGAAGSALSVLRCCLNSTPALRGFWVRSARVAGRVGALVYGAGGATRGAEVGADGDHPADVKLNTSFL